MPAFTGILLRNSNLVQIEYVFLSLRVPKNRFMPARESMLAVEAMFVMPNDPISKIDFIRAGVRLEERVKQQVKRKHLAMSVNMMTYLPTNTATIPGNPDGLRDNEPLKFDIALKTFLFFIRLAHVIGGRSDDELSAVIGYLLEEI